jgi:hypothetical protein
VRLADCKFYRQALSVAQIDKESVKTVDLPVEAAGGGVWRTHEVTVARDVEMPGGPSPPGEKAP